MRKAIIHIGHGKTGTSSIQKWLAENPDTLKTHGYHYLESYRILNAHHNLAPNTRVPLHPDIVKSVQDELASTSENIIVSSEQIYYTTADNFADMISLFSGLEIEIILYTRWHEELIVSTYMQWMREKKAPCRDAFDFFQKYGRVFQFQKRLDLLFSQLAAKPKTRVRVYMDRNRSGATETQNQFEHFNALNDFVEVLGLPVLETAGATAVNRSLSPLFARALYRLNESSVSDEDYKAALQTLESVSNKLDWQIEDIFTDEQRAYLRAYFAPDDALVSTMADDEGQRAYWLSRLADTEFLEAPQVVDEPAHFGEAAYQKAATEAVTN